MDLSDKALNIGATIPSATQQSPVANQRRTGVRSNPYSISPYLNIDPTILAQQVGSTQKNSPPEF